MVRTETYELNGRQFVRTWSDAHRYVVRDGIFYGEAHDPAEFGRTYVEGELIPSEEWEADPDEATTEDYEAALSDLGVKL
jgi:hypothetical protein